MIGFMKHLVITNKFYESLPGAPRLSIRHSELANTPVVYIDFEAAAENNQILQPEEKKAGKTNPEKCLHPMHMIRKRQISLRVWLSSGF